MRHLRYLSRLGQMRQLCDLSWLGLMRQFCHLIRLAQMRQLCELSLLSQMRQLCGLNWLGQIRQLFDLSQLFIVSCFPFLLCEFTSLPFLLTLYCKAHLNITLWNLRYDKYIVLLLSYYYHFFVIQGLLADKLGSYVLPFQIAGGIVLAGAFIPFMLLCTERRNRTKSILQEMEGDNLEGTA